MGCSVPELRLSSGMLIEGSCHCGRVKFRLESSEPWPYQLCYCSICRKTAGAGGYCINLGGDASTLEVEGRDHLATYRALIEEGGTQVESSHARHFCRTCGSHLWASNDRWPSLAHPVAGAVDTPLPAAPGRVHMMDGARAPWVPGPPSNEARFEAYPKESLADWHRARGYEDADDA